jgi:putative membrane protein
MKLFVGSMPTVLALIFWTVPAHAQGLEGREFYRHYDFGFGHMLFGGLMMIAFWGGIIVLIILAVRWLSSGGPAGRERPSGRQSALEILQERHARGETDHDEFEKRKRLLTE